MSYVMKFLMLTSFVCLITALATTEIRAKKFKKIYVEKDSWVSNEIAALDSPGRLNGYVMYYFEELTTRGSTLRGLYG